MTKALFITSPTSDARNMAVAYEKNVGPVTHITFDVGGDPIDGTMLATAEETKPEVIFYIGAVEGPGLASIDTLRALKAMAPLVHMSGDLGDPPWWPVLEEYKQAGCMSLTVTMDGAPNAPVDIVTLTPLDVSAFDGPSPSPERDIRCGFPGNYVTKERYREVFKLYRTFDPRSRMLHEIDEKVTLRQREVDGNYSDYVAFLKRCQIVLNTSWTGSGKVHHVKGRVLEAAFAGCAVLEMVQAPTFGHFPAYALHSYASPPAARKFITSATDQQLRLSADILGAYAREHFHPKVIYRTILNKL